MNSSVRVRCWSSPLLPSTSLPRLRSFCLSPRAGASHAGAALRFRSTRQAPERRASSAVTSLGPSTSAPAVGGMSTPSPGTSWTKCLPASSPCSSRTHWIAVTTAARSGRLGGAAAQARTRVPRLPDVSAPLTPNFGRRETSVGSGRGRPAAQLSRQGPDGPRSPAGSGGEPRRGPFPPDRRKRGRPLPLSRLLRLRACKSGGR